MSTDLFNPPPAARRAPTKGEHVCVGCKAAAIFGVGSAWYCWSCAPPDFLPANRRPR